MDQLLRIGKSGPERINTGLWITMLHEIIERQENELLSLRIENRRLRRRKTVK